MNGIIHPCFHPEDRANPTSEAEVFRNIFEYIDRLFSIIRPRKLMYMAIDGVAPRAKMNQQRSRRFRAAQEAQERKREESSLRRQLEREGIKVPPPEDDSAKFDSNVITPGTPFMWRLSIALQYYIHLRLNHSPAWRNVEVILSDSNSPGEGEHKVMKFIRLQRGLDGYDPNMRHVVYGLDADLIMLCLATHEAHCTILREQVQPNKQDSETEEEKMQRILREAEDQRKREGKEDNSEERKPPISTKPFQLLSIPKLRQYLQLDLQLHDPNVPQDDEAILDDFVFMCFFVGNDFLPHSPTLEIREKAIDLLMQVYKSNLRHIGGHLCTGPDVHLDRVERFARLVAQYEEQIFVVRLGLSGCSECQIKVRSIRSHISASQKRMRIADKQKNIRQREKQSKGGRIDHRDPGARPQVDQMKSKISH
jgi:5'-3' exoribonuclease 2